MRQRPVSAVKSEPNPSSSGTESTNIINVPKVVAKRSGYIIMTMFLLVIYGSWGVYHYQFESLPQPLTALQVGKRGFSEHEAMKHVVALTLLGPHPVGSHALDLALKHVRDAAEAIKKTAHWEVDVEVDYFHTKYGVNLLRSGLFEGKTLAFSDLNHIAMRILPKYAPEAGDNAILISSHVDTVSSAEGAGDCGSNIAVMLELARGISQWAHGFKHAVIFLFNTGEEEGLNGANSFITQHPWSYTIQLAIDLEAVGIGGRSGIFQAGPNPWAIENFAMVAKYPSAQIVSQDLFSSGAIKSGTDFQVYKEIAGLSGLDFAFSDNTAVYHTKNDKLDLLKPGSLQHLGENMLAFLLHAAAASDLPKAKESGSDAKSSADSAIYFDILGSYLIVYRQRFATMLYNSVIMQSLLIWATSLFMGGSSAVMSFALSCLSVLLMWIGAISCASLIAVILPILSSSPVPFVSCPLLIVGLFGAPALIGAFTGQHVGYLIICAYLSKKYQESKRNLSSAIQADIAKLDSERWLFKGGLLQWLLLLILGNYYRIGSSYLAFVWLVGPAFAYGLLEATLSPARLPRPLKTLTLLVGLSVPFLLSSGIIIQLTATLTGSVVRFERSPGSHPDWIMNVVIAIFVAAIVCLTLVHLLSYIHISGAKGFTVLASSLLFGVAITAVLSGFIPAFTEDTSRAVNVVHVVETRGMHDGKQDITSFVSLFSTTPGNLIREAELIGKGLLCGKDKTMDFVTFQVKYSCWTDDDAEIGWEKSDIPELHVKSDIKAENRVTKVLLDTKLSTRWSLGINTQEITDFFLEGNDGEEFISLGEKSNVDGWHIIQFSGGKQAPTKFALTLVWASNQTHTATEEREGEEILLKLRTDVDRVTPLAEDVLQNLPKWCSLFGKSSSPYTLAFLTSLPVAIS